jgi:hypothetical protein
MPPNQAKIVLTNPCSENWNAMQVDPIGRFCQSCQKSVIDFTSKSDHEIKTFLKDKQGEQLCGRFYVHQVERIRIEIDQNILISNIPFWQKFLAVVLVCFGADFLGIDFVFAQTDTDSIPMITQPVDSLDSISLVQADSTLEVTVDSLLKVPPFKKEIESVCSIMMGDMIITTGATMGMISIREEWIWNPILEIDINEDKSKEDTTVSKTGIANASKNDPIAPKHPKKKPSPPENALIANNGDRRKTRRS